MSSNCNNAAAVTAQKPFPIELLLRIDHIIFKTSTCCPGVPYALVAYLAPFRQ